MADKNNEAITTKFKVDISDLKKGISEANSQIKLANSQFKKASSEMDNWAKSSDGLKAKINQLKSVMDQQNRKLETYQKQLNIAQEYEKKAGDEVKRLKEELEKAKKTYGDNSEEVKKLQKELDNAEASERQMRNQVAELSTTLNNQEAAINRTAKEIDGYEGSLKDVEAAEKRAAKSGRSIEEELEAMSKEADEATDKMAGLGKAILSGLGKAAAVGLAAVSAGIVAVTKSAVEGYASYEQLVGGVETLFGTGGQSVEEYAKSVGKSVNKVKKEYSNLEKAQANVINNANKAYKTAGMSANDYIETVTSFSASLISSLNGNTVKAARVADQAIIDMSDNANKMGTDIGSIQNAYQGFAKQNYTMLDNLKLGYGGTKTEMQRLINDANKVKKANGEMAKLSINSFADVTEAIHIMQSQMGITGTTSKEAATTIEGSINSMKSSWQNFVVGLADDKQSVGPLLDNFIESLTTVAKNLYPVMETVVTTIFNQLGSKLPGVINALFDSVEKMLPVYIKPVVSAVQSLFNFILKYSDEVIAALAGIGTGFLVFKIGTMIDTAITALTALFATIEAGGGIVATFNAIMAANPIGVVAVAVGVLIGVLVLLVKNWDAVKAAAVKSWEQLKVAWGNASTWFKGSVIEPIKRLFGSMWESIKTTFGNVKGWFKSTFESAWTAIRSVFSNWGTFFSGLWNRIKSTFTGLGTKLGNAIGGSVKAAINGVISKIQSTINNGISMINGAIGVINMLPGVNIGKIGALALPRLAKGGYALGSALANIGEAGKEAVIPLERNLGWAKIMADQLLKQLDVKSVGGSMVNGINGIVGGGTSIVYNQYNTSPKALSRADIYRNTRNLLKLKEA